MKGTVNKVTLIGNVGKDVAYTASANGVSVAKFSVATTDYLDKNKEPHTEWHSVVSFGKLAEIVSQYVTKGAKVYVEGRIQKNTWEDKDGAKRLSVDIIAHEMQLMGKKPHDSQSASAPLDDSDIPF